MDIKTVIATVAPWIASAMGSPLAGMAVSAAADALGLSDKTEAAIKQAISGATPEQMLALKAADADFAVKMQQLGFQNLEAMAKLENEDRDSARNREILVKDMTPKVLAYLVTAGFFGMLVFMFFKGIPNDSRDILNIMLGALGSTFTSIISYFFGSTKGSEAKSALLANSTQDKT